MPSFGTLKADTLTHSTAGSLDTNYVVNGAAKTVARYNGQDDSSSFSSNLNLASVTDRGTGIHTLSYTNNFDNNEYTTASSNFDGLGENDVRLIGSSSDRNYTTSELQFYTCNGSGTLDDSSKAMLVLFGDLA
nr:hypothetical protein 36 [Alphaproteobacteria bacterium]